MKEIYKIINIYNNKKYNNYMVSNYGNVKNIKTGRILKPIKNNITGYYCVGLYSEDKKHSMILIHRLVLLHHGYNKHNKPNVNHIDGNKANNHISNLEWVTHKENMEHANRLGLIKHNPPKGERAGSAKFSNEDAIKISEMLDQGVSTKEIAKIYGVSTMTILRLKKGDTWSSVTGRGQ